MSDRCPTCGSDDPKVRYWKQLAYGKWWSPVDFPPEREKATRYGQRYCPDPFHTDTPTSSLPPEVEEALDYFEAFGYERTSAHAATLRAHITAQAEEMERLTEDAEIAGWERSQFDRATAERDAWKARATHPSGPCGLGMRAR